MKPFKPHIISFTLLVMAVLGGCATATKSPDVTDSIRKSLDLASLKDVTVSQDRDKGVVTLGGHVPADADKAQAESVAKSLAGAQVVANQIAVTPPGAEGAAKKVNSALDDGIESNMKAALIQNQFDSGVRYDVKNGVVTLRGEVGSQARRGQIESLAATVPNVQQVVNELQVTKQKATSTN